MWNYEKQYKNEVANLADYIQKVHEISTVDT